MNDRGPASPASGMTPGQRFRHALETTSPLPIVGTINPYCAMIAERVGHKAIYLAGGGLATYSYGMPDLAMTTLTEVRRISDASSLPLMVDVDIGFGGAFNIARLVKGLIKDGAAAMHMEDQVQLKRCGHRPGKAVVPTVEMVDRIKAALDARTDSSFFVCALCVRPHHGSKFLGALFDRPGIMIDTRCRSNQPGAKRITCVACGYEWARRDAAGMHAGSRSSPLA